MRRTAVVLYILGTLLLVSALLAAGAKPNKAGVVAGGAAVLSAAVVNISLQRRQNRLYTTTDWLKGKRAKGNPVRSGLWFLAVFFAGANVLLLDSPYSASRHYFAAALLLVYVIIFGLDVFDKVDTPLFSRRTNSENAAPH